MTTRLRTRIQMQLVAAAAAPEDLDAAATNGTFHLVAIVQGIETGDGRIYEKVTWRDLPLPCMAQDWTDVEHMNSVLVGNITSVEYVGDEVHARGPYLNDPDEEAARLIAMAKNGELRGVSADLDDVEFEVLFPMPTAEEQAQIDAQQATWMCEDSCVTNNEGDEAAIAACQEACRAASDVDEPETEEIDGRTYEVVSFPREKLRVTEARLMGATILPFPALQEAWVEFDGADPAAAEPAPAADAAPVLALAASAVIDLPAHGMTGVVLTGRRSLQASTGTSPATVAERPASRFTIPEIPPVSWFEVDEPPGGPMPLTIMDDGQVFGHLAVWGECHIGIHGECVTPPPSTCSYARFHVGEIPVDGGRGRMSVGRLTFATGHAGKHLGAGPALEHYDRSGSVGADLRAVDGEYGIWVCGALRSTLSVAQIREIMSCPPSGDWRSFGGDLELVAALAVPVPGFNTPRRELLLASGWAGVRREDGLVETLVASRPAGATILASAVETSGLPADEELRIVEFIAESIGRSTMQKVDALAASVHGR